MAHLHWLGPADKQKVQHSIKTTSLEKDGRIQVKNICSISTAQTTQWMRLIPRSKKRSRFLVLQFRACPDKPSNTFRQRNFLVKCITWTSKPTKSYFPWTNVMWIFRNLRQCHQYSIISMKYRGTGLIHNSLRKLYGQPLKLRQIQSIYIKNYIFYHRNNFWSKMNDSIVTYTYLHWYSFNMQTRLPFLDYFHFMNTGGG